MPCNCLSLGASGVVIPGSHGTVTTGDAVFGQLPSPGHSTSRKKPIPSFSVKKVYLLGLELQAEGQASGLLV